MAAIIGTLSFDSWQGQFQAPVPVVSEFGRAGTAGTGIMVSAARGIPVSVRTAKLGSLATCQTHQTDCEALIGTIVAATDNFARSYAATAVVSCSTAVSPVRGVSGITHICIAEWVLIPEAT